ncbi:unnamed protein product [Urochloa humidicola]
MGSLVDEDHLTHKGGHWRLRRVALPREGAALLPPLSCATAGSSASAEGSAGSCVAASLHYQQEEEDGTRS